MAKHRRELKAFIPDCVKGDDQQRFLVALIRLARQHDLDISLYAQDGAWLETIDRVKRKKRIAVDKC